CRRIPAAPGIARPANVLTSPCARSGQIAQLPRKHLTRKSYSRLSFCENCQRPEQPEVDVPADERNADGWMPFPLEGLITWEQVMTISRVSLTAIALMLALGLATDGHAQ